MIEFGREYYVDNKYFFLKKRKDSIDVYYSVNDTLTEARTFDEKVSFPINMEKNVKIVVEKALKSKKVQRYFYQQQPKKLALSRKLK